MSQEIAKFLMVILGVAGLVAIPIAGYAAFVATRAIWVKGEPGQLGDATLIRDELEQVRARVAELESVPDRLAELEERIDFSERLLAQREPERLPGERR